MTVGYSDPLVTFEHEGSGGSAGQQPSLSTAQLIEVAVPCEVCDPGTDSKKT